MGDSRSDEIRSAEQVRPLRFTLRQVECFLAVAEAGSISRAASRLSASESSVADAISGMERSLGAKLFQRQRSRGVTLTSDGKTALPLAQRILSDGSELSDAIGKEAGTVAGLVRIGCVGTLASLILPSLLVTVGETLPGIHIEYVIDDFVGLQERLENAELDLIIAFDIDVPPEFSSLKFATTQAMAVVAEHHPLAHRSKVELTELAAEPMILLDISSSRTHTLELMSARGVKPRIAHRTTDYELCRSLVGQGLGYSLLMRRQVSLDTWDGNRVTYIPISPSPREVDVLLAWPPMHLSHRVRAVVDCAKSVSKTMSPTSGL